MGWGDTRQGACVQVRITSGIDVPLVGCAADSRAPAMGIGQGRVVPRAHVTGSQIPRSTEAVDFDYLGGLNLHS